MVGEKMEWEVHVQKPLYGNGSVDAKARHRSINGYDYREARIVMMNPGKS